MVQAIIILLLTWGLSELLIERNRSLLRHPRWYFTLLFWWHTLFAGAYYLYVQFNRSDSYAYLERAATDHYGYGWMGQYGTGTKFVTWLAYPFVNYLNFSYESMMVLFSFLGFVGFLGSYFFIVENTRFRHRLWGIDFLLLILFLPNMHFWTVSLGKGSVALCGMGLLLFGFSQLKARPFTFTLGALLLFHVRPHVFLVLLLALGLSTLFSTGGVKVWQKGLIILVAAALITPLMNSVLENAKIQTTNEEAISEFLTHRTSELKKATSAVDLDTYSQPVKLFTFWFRPLFVDAPNLLGLFISVENLLYLLLFIKLFSRRFIQYIFQSHWMVKTTLIAFLGVSFALAQISSNMGLAIRQKSQVMYLFLFVLIAYADWMYQRYGKEVI